MSGPADIILQSIEPRRRALAAKGEAMAEIGALPGAALTLTGGIFKAVQRKKEEDDVAAIEDAYKAASSSGNPTALFGVLSQLKPKTLAGKQYLTKTIERARQAVHAFNQDEMTKTLKALTVKGKAADIEKAQKDAEKEFLGKTALSDAQAAIRRDPTLLDPEGPGLNGYLTSKRPGNVSPQDWAEAVSYATKQMEPEAERRGKANKALDTEAELADLQSVNRAPIESIISGQVQGTSPKGIARQKQREAAYWQEKHRGSTLRNKETEIRMAERRLRLAEQNAANAKDARAKADAEREVDDARSDARLALSLAQTEGDFRFSPEDMSPEGQKAYQSVKDYLGKPRGAIPATAPTAAPPTRTAPPPGEPEKGPPVQDIQSLSDLQLRAKFLSTEDPGEKAALKLERDRRLQGQK